MSNTSEQPPVNRAMAREVIATFLERVAVMSTDEFCYRARTTYCITLPNDTLEHFYFRMLIQRQEEIERQIARRARFIRSFTSTDPATSELANHPDYMDNFVAAEKGLLRTLSIIFGTHPTPGPVLPDGQRDLYLTLSRDPHPDLSGRTPSSFLAYMSRPLGPPVHRSALFGSFAESQTMLENLAKLRRMRIIHFMDGTEPFTPFARRVAEMRQTYKFRKFVVNVNNVTSLLVARTQPSSTETLVLPPTTLPRVLSSSAPPATSAASVAPSVGIKRPREDDHAASSSSSSSSSEDQDLAEAARLLLMLRDM